MPKQHYNYSAAVMDTLADYPTFLVIGAQKCGTSWLAHMIRQHPEVSAAEKKELHFFDLVDNYKRGLGWYRSQFTINQLTKAVGECTPGYFATNYNELDIQEHKLNRNIPKLIHDAFPDVKLILSLRNPVKRAISAYYHHIRRGRFSPGQRFSLVVRNQAIYLRGCYDIHMKQWLEYFPRQQFLILIYEEDLKDEAKPTTLSRVFQHIGVDASFRPSDLYERFNAQLTHFDMRCVSWPKLIGTACRKLVPNVIKTMDVWRIEVTDSEKDLLRKSYEKHNVELENILGRKLPWH